MQRDLSVAELEWVARLRMVMVPLVRQLRQYGAEPLTPTQLSVLGSIDRCGPLSLGDLAARERLSPPMISKVVVALEDHGFVERLTATSDRRVCLVQTSPKGAQWVEDGRDRRNRWLATRVAQLDRDDRAALSAAIEPLERLLETGEL